ncbi:MAG TPA: potassium transporter TrkG, partial [Syntrophales bacterium]|nr:potassium transporter TrkG [Syntrophales bacterium]
MKHTPPIEPPVKRGFFSHQLSPGQIFILSFAGLILAGAFLLWFPFSSSGENLEFIDALFTATSSVCVTGLAVLDVGKDLSFAGQVITLLLFQIGGLGIITFSVLLFGIMGRGVSFKEREIVQTTFLHTPKRDFLVILKAVLGYTLIIESMGVLFLFIRFSQDFQPGRAFFHALYHAVSAFNNCGYSLFPDNLIGYQGDLIVNLTVMALIVLGGIGFVVLHEMVSRFRSRQIRLSVHSRIVIYTTAILIVSGAFLFYFFERNHVIRDM